MLNEKINVENFNNVLENILLEHIQTYQKPTFKVQNKHDLKS